MANEFARNIQDAAVSPAAFVLPDGESKSTYSTVIDIGADTYKAGDFELQLSVPALSATLVPDTKTVTYKIESSTTEAFTAVDAIIATKTITAAGGTGAAATVIRARIPSNCARYIRFGVTTGAGATDSSAVSATGSVLF